MWKRLSVYIDLCCAGVASQALLQSTLHSAQSKARAAAGASAGGPSDAMAGVLGGSESLSNLSQVSCQLLID